LLPVADMRFLNLYPDMITHDVWPACTRNQLLRPCHDVVGGETEPGQANDRHAACASIRKLLLVAETMYSIEAPSGRSTASGDEDDALPPSLWTLVVARSRLLVLSAGLRLARCCLGHLVMA